MAGKRGFDRNQATVVERKVPAYNRLKTDCVARRSVWLRIRTAGGVRAGGPSAPGYSILEFLNFCCTWPFLTLPNFKLYFVVIVKCVPISFCMVDK